MIRWDVLQVVAPVDHATASADGRGRRAKVTVLGYALRGDVYLGCERLLAAGGRVEENHAAGGLQVLMPEALAAELTQERDAARRAAAEATRVLSEDDWARHVRAAIRRLPPRLLLRVQETRVFPAAPAGALTQEEIERAASAVARQLAGA